MKNYYEYDAELSLPYGWGWPKGVPKDFNDLIKSHGDFIERKIKSYNKVKSNSADIYQGVWQRLLEADVIHKFVNGAARRLPLTMNSMQACWFLGISPRRWQSFIRHHSLAATVVPCLGNRFDSHAVWPTSFVCECDYEDVFKGKQTGTRFRPDVSSCGFKTYLQMAIHNAFANICRTKSRRHKEQVLSPTTVLSLQSDGSYHQGADIEGHSSWEAHITAAMTNEEALLDLLDGLRQTGIDFDSEKGIEILEYIMHQGRSSDGPRRNVELLGFLGQGYTLEESVSRVQQKVRIRSAG